MMGGMGGGMMGADGGDVTYPLFLINGRPANDPDTLAAKPGQKVRLRIINAASDTIFDVALAGHDLTVTHTDGYPVNPVTAKALRIGMGERYDATVTLADGVFPLVAHPVGKDGQARAHHPHRAAVRSPTPAYRPVRARLLPADRRRPDRGPGRRAARPGPGLGAAVGPARVAWAPTCGRSTGAPTTRPSR